jgi:hypothetical protein
VTLSFGFGSTPAGNVAISSEIRAVLATSRASRRSGPLERLHDAFAGVCETVVGFVPAPRAPGVRVPGVTLVSVAAVT